MKDPNICEKMKYGTFLHGKPFQYAKHSVMAGLKWPPEVGAQTYSVVSRKYRKLTYSARTMIANAIPIAKASPIWKREPYAEITGAVSGFAAASVNDAMLAMPGYT